MVKNSYYLLGDMIINRKEFINKLYIFLIEKFTKKNIMFYQI